MSICKAETLDPCSITPFNFIDPNHPFNQNPSREPEGFPVDIHGNLPTSAGDPDPNDPSNSDDDDDSPDPPPIPSPIINHPDSDRFITALLQLADSLRDLRWNP